MPGAITMSYDYTDSQDTGDPDDDGMTDDDTGDFLSEILGGGTQLLSSILGGGKGKPGQGIGQGIGALAGAGLGTLAGGAGAGIGASLGKAAGGAIENLVRSQTKKKPVAKKTPPPKKAPPHPKRTRVPTKRERKMLVEAEQMSRRTGEPGYAEEARLRVYRPADYKRRRDAQLLWSQNVQADESQDAQFGEFDESPYLEDSYAPYDETAAPEARPQPRRHISAVPMSNEQMAALLRAVPQLQTLDPRLLRTMSGSANVARDVSGVDPTTGTYHALPGETPHGITKKLTGQVERTQELLAANPGKSETAGQWNIPPGWLQYVRETGAPTFTTLRKYIVVLNDTPIGIAKKMNAFVDRPQWWSELKAANPHKPTQSGTGNWVSLYPNEEIGIPNAWPENSYTLPVTVQPSQPEAPGLPGPGKTTIVDPGVVPHAQALLAKWALTHPNECTPSDFGRNPADLLSGVTPRMTQALSSFQTWWNKNHPTQSIATNGELDTATYHALIEADNATTTPSTTSTTPTTNGAPAGWPNEWPWPPFPSTSTTTSPQPTDGPSSTPSTTTQPAPSTNTQTTPTTQSNGAPAGWPNEWPWPPIPGYTVPLPTTQQPSGSTPPAPSTNTQPAEATQSNGAPLGWPKEWPWPPIPGNTTPNTTTTTPPSGSTTPAPNTTTPSTPTTQSNGAPPGWPKEWPWPPIPVNTTPNTTTTTPPSGSTTPAPNTTTPSTPTTQSNGAPPGWPKEWPWPPIPGYTLPNTTTTPPAGGTTPAPNTTTPSTPTTQSNGAPPGWPKEWPWPPIPGYTLPNTTTTPPAGGTTPAPNTTTPSTPTTQSNGAPPGWPKEWPWPLPGCTPPNPTTPQPPSGSTSTGPSTNTTPPSTTTSSPPLDSHLSEREKQQLALLLSNGNDADQLDGLAVDYVAAGFPLTAAALHARADAIRAQSQNQGPPVIFVVDAPPQPTTPTTESSGSVLPVLALIGAGLAFS